jgi:aquaporin TIP
MHKLHPYLAEFIGTFALIFIGVGSIHSFANVPGGLLGIALAHGLTIAVFVSATMHISGGQLNPAVTLGVWVGGKIAFAHALGYWCAQLAGALLAALCCVGIFGREVVQAGTPQLGPGVGFFTGVFVEIILTFFLVFVVFGTGVDERGRKIGGLAIGLTVALDILFGGPITGASMNPARTFGPALVSGMWDNHLVYWIGPLLGGALAGWVYGRYFLKMHPHP